MSGLGSLRRSATDKLAYGEEMARAHLMDQGELDGSQSPPYFPRAVCELRQERIRTSPSRLVVLWMSQRWLTPLIASEKLAQIACALFRRGAGHELGGYVYNGNGSTSSGTNNSSESERANPGVWLTSLYRQAEAGKRLLRGAQTIGIFAGVPVAHVRRDQIMACDVAGRSA